jgi:hypothetical protein
MFYLKFFAPVLYEYCVGEFQKSSSPFLNPLKPKLTCIIFKNSVRTSKRTPHFTITNINWLMLFKGIIVVYSDNHIKPINTK